MDTSIRVQGVRVINERLVIPNAIPKTMTYADEFFLEWNKTCERLKNSGYDLAKIKITKRG